MLLAKQAHYNDLSPKLIDTLHKRIESFGKSVRYKFNISKPNPDPTHYNGVDTIWPNAYTLDPAVFDIMDHSEDRPNAQKSKRIALIKTINSEKGIPDSFHKIRVYGKDKGILRLDVVENNEHFNFAMFLELHPKQIDGLFADRTKQQIFSRIDENAFANEQRQVRSAKKKALDIAEQMSDKQIVEFADAMMWDSSEAVILLRNKVEDLAENSPEYFNDLVGSKSIEYQSVIQQALNKGIISYNPAEMKFMWASNQQTISILQPVGDKTHIEKMAEWIQSGGDKAEQVFKKIKSLTK